MKKFVLLIWVLFSVHQVFAQGWLQRYGNRSDNTSFQAIAPTQDGGYFQAGFANGSTQLYLVKTDAEGNIIAERKYATETNKEIINEVHMVDAGDGTFVIAYVTDTAFGKNNLFVEKFNQNCRKIWTQSFGNGFPVILGDIKRLSDNSFATLVTQTSRIGDSAAILKTTQLGVTILQKRIMPLNRISASALTESTDKALYFTTKPNGASDTARLIKATANGDLIWSKKIGTFGAGLNINNIHKIATTSDGGFAILGNYFAKIDTNGVVQWFVNQKFITFPTAFVVNPDGSFTLATGYDTQSLAAIKLLLYKIKSNGEIISSKTISSYDGASNNSVLNFDLANTSDGGIVITGEEDKSNGSIARTFKIGQDGHLYVNERKIYVYIDKNSNCKFDGGEQLGFKYATIELISRTDPNKIRRARADSLGKYQISVDTGSYTVNLKGYSSYFTPCTDAVTFTDDINYPLSEDSLYIGLKPTTVCPQMEITVSTPALQRCQLNTYKIHYCNLSGNLAQNVYATVKLDSLLAFQKADKNFTLSGTRTYKFDIGNVTAGQCGDISFTAIPACNDSTVVGQALSVEAHIYPDSFCVVPNYLGAVIGIDAQCTTDSVRFLVRNSGKSPSSSQTNSTNIVVDEVVFLKTAPVIPSQGIQKYTYPANGKTYRMEVSQEINNPGFSKAPTVAIEGCGRKSDGTFSTGFVKQFAEDDGDYFTDKDVRILRNDVFGNEMDASPTGYATQHFINKNDDIEYLVRFRNTTNDTLYNVEVRDTLSDFVDPTTIELGASNQPYQMQIFEKKILKFVFNNVKITPDAFNRDKAWGFLKFRIKLKQNIPNGTVINNKAEILFNDGSVVTTNKIFHTVGQNFIITATVDKSIEDKNVLEINIAPNPFSEQAQFTINTKENILGTNTFEMYDVAGRLVRREFFEGDKFIFNRQTLGTGVYVFRVISRLGESTGRLAIINN